MSDKLRDDFFSETVLDKGYHSKQTLIDLNEMNIRSYASEPDRGRQKWEGDDEARDAVYANRRRIKADRGKRLLKRRGEFIERSFAHCYETGAMRRLHLRRPGEHRQAGNDPRRCFQHRIVDACVLRPAQTQRARQNGCGVA